MNNNEDPGISYDYSSLIDWIGLDFEYCLNQKKWFFGATQQNPRN
jgi:hypothetical protein